MSSVQSWTGDAIDVALAADFEGSLSCLGIELGTENYDMSAPLHSLMQSVSATDYTDSHENGDTSPSRDSPFPSVESLRNSAHSIQAKKTRLALNGDEDVSIKRFCVSSEDKENNENSQSSRCRHSSSAPDLRATGSHSISNTVSVLSPSMLSQIFQIPDPPTFASTSLKNTRFQYVLGAATSIATKINEESMTYLNQGQSYEIKLKKLGDLTEMRGKMLKSIIRVGFQERRLQFSEKEQIAQWQSQRIGERILEIDIPLSYGVYDVSNDPSNIHICEFLWDPTNETGVFIRLNCISTEFTPKKHGGEKGAPFRIQIETFSHEESYSQRLHVAACQVKVFKPKGADRKHKTDREKMSKRPQAEQDKYRTSYDCTVLTECAPDPLYITGCSLPTASSALPAASIVSCSTPKKSPDSISIQKTFSLSNCKSKSESIELSDVSVNSPEKFQPSDCLDLSSEVAVKKEVDVIPQPTQIIAKEKQDIIMADFTVKETVNWLQKNNFNVDLFVNYNGTDLLRLSRDDCIRICGNTDGVRLYNTLICKPVFPKKVLFVRLSLEDVFQAVYLHELCASHLIAKLTLLFHIPLENVQDLHIQTGIAAHYAVTDEVVENIQNESLFTMELILHDHSVDNHYIILLKPYKEDL